MIGEDSMSTYGEIIDFEAKLAAAFARDADGLEASCERDDAGAVIVVDFGWDGEDDAA